MNIVIIIGFVYEDFDKSFDNFSKTQCASKEIFVMKSIKTRLILIFTLIILILTSSLGYISIRVMKNHILESTPVS